MRFQGHGEISRRKLLEVSGLGIGSLALKYLLRNDLLLAAENERNSSGASILYTDLKPSQGHFPAQAKAMIQLFQNGGPSQS